MAGGSSTLFGSIEPGDRVTILTPRNQRATGRAVMRGPYGWVLNMGGRHGTPGIATEANTIMVQARQGKRGWLG